MAVDDSAVIRAGVTRGLAAGGAEVAAALEDAGTLMETIDRLLPDVVVIDIRMPPTHTDEGIRAARAIRARHPTTGVMVLSSFAEPDHVQHLLEDGSDGLGYLLEERGGDVEDFVAAIRVVARGGTVLDPAVVGLLIAPGAAPAPTARVATGARRPPSRRWTRWCSSTLRRGRERTAAGSLASSVTASSP